MMRSRIVMDIDDTISTHRNRDYENAIPNLNMIRKMQELSKQGVEFVLYTARGQISCNGDIKKIEEEKGPTLEHGLKSIMFHIQNFGLESLLQMSMLMMPQ